jgi:hypothetical protein
VYDKGLIQGLASFCMIGYPHLIVSMDAVQIDVGDLVEVGRGSRAGLFGVVIAIDPYGTMPFEVTFDASLIGLNVSSTWFYSMKELRVIVKNIAMLIA